MTHLSRVSVERVQFALSHTRRFFWQAQGGKCGLCGQAIKPKFGSPKLTFDHVWPRARAASFDIRTGNTLLAHERCNKAKGDRSPTGCEIVMLHAVNRRLGLGENETSCWDRVA